MDCRHDVMASTRLRVFWPPVGASPSGGQHPSGGTGGVVVVTPPVVVRDQGTVITASRPVAAATVKSAAVVTQPCNCLTKPYLDDGSVLFNDICTKEAAMATPADLKAQKTSTAQ